MALKKIVKVIEKIVQKKVETPKVVLPILDPSIPENKQRFLR